MFTDFCLFFYLNFFQCWTRMLFLFFGVRNFCRVLRVSLLWCCFFFFKYYCQCVAIKSYFGIMSSCCTLILPKCSCDNFSDDGPRIETCRKQTMVFRWWPKDRNMSETYCGFPMMAQGSKHVGNRLRFSDNGPRIETCRKQNMVFRWWPKDRNMSETDYGFPMMAQGSKHVWNRLWFTDDGPRIETCRKQTMVKCILYVYWRVILWVIN